MSVTITINGTDYDVPSSAADTNWAADQVAFEQALNTYVATIATDLTELTAAVGSPTWIAPSLVNSWANIGAGVATAGYYKDNQGTVHLRGALHSGTSATTAFTLPSGYRPPGSTSLLAFASSGVAVISVSTAGAVTITNLTAGTSVNSAVALDGLNFSTVA